MKRQGIGIIGCGNISTIYIENLSKRFDSVKLVACADLDLERAKQAAAAAPGVKAMSVEALLADPGIDIVVNLTIPAAHHSVALRVIEAGKSVYNEKPLTLSREEGAELLDRAQANGVRVGCAPDTFLGAGIQTCLKMIEEGVIGRPIGAQAFFLSHGPESWHPSPAFFYQRGGGPVFDMGPYYLTALVALLGPIRRVAGVSRMSFPARTAGHESIRGQTISVEVPTHVHGTLEFESGIPATFAASFDVWGSKTPRIEIFGSEGSISVPDPNTFGGPVRLYRAHGKEWEEVALINGHSENARGLGVADMASAITGGRDHRASGALAFHVLDTMHAIHEAAESENWVTLESTVERPIAFRPEGMLQS